MVRMSELITSAVNQRPDGIIVTIPDPSALGDAIRIAIASGKQVRITMEGDAFGNFYDRTR